MKIFSINFKTGNLDLDALVTASENNHKFKVEMVTGEPDPIVLRYNDAGDWTIENTGGRLIPQQGIDALCSAIEAHITKSI